MGFTNFNSRRVLCGSSSSAVSGASILTNPRRRSAAEVTQRKHSNQDTRAQLAQSFTLEQTERRCGARTFGDVTMKPIATLAMNKPGGWIRRLFTPYWLRLCLSSPFLLGCVCLIFVARERFRVSDPD